MPRALDDLAREYLEQIWAASPIAATQHGEHRFDDRLDELTEPALDDQIRDLRALLREVLPADAGAAGSGKGGGARGQGGGGGRGRQGDGAAAARADGADRDALAATMVGRLFTLEVERPWRRNPFVAATAVPAAILDLATRRSGSKRDRAVRLTHRLEAVPRFLEQAQALLVEPCPELWRRMAGQAALGGAAVLEEGLAGWAAGTPQADGLDAAVAAAAGSLRGFADWLREEHADRGPQDAPFALEERALGFLLREVHHLPAGAAELVTAGRAEVARVSQELAEHAGRRGEDDWAAWLARTRSRRPSRRRLMEAYQQQMERLLQVTTEHQLASVPDAALALARTPVLLRASIPAAAYQPPGPFEPDQQGLLWVTPPRGEDDLRGHAVVTLPVVLAHEGWPGHHLQVATANRLPSLARRAIRSPLLAEGWGLYAEALVADAGGYDDESRLAQLAMRLLRAARLVADLQLASGAAGFDEAARELAAAARVAPALARNEVARCAIAPGRSFAALAGCLELERLAGDARAREGPAFRLRDLHDRVLAHGQMPPALIARSLAADPAAPAGGGRGPAGA